MPVTTKELAHARGVVEKVLDRLDVETYIFDIEPMAGQWELKVECAIDEGWGSFSLLLDETFPGDRKEQERLLVECRKRLAACRQESSD
jgi:hypothetical protein